MDLVGRDVEEEGRRAGRIVDVELDGGVEAEESGSLGAVQEDAECDGKRASRRIRCIFIITIVLIAIRGLLLSLEPGGQLFVMDAAVFAVG